MLIHNEVISLLFRLINFAALIALAWYLFKKYGLQAMKRAMAQQQEALLGLYTQQSTLDKQHAYAKTQYLQDEQEGYRLLEKIKSWKTAIDDAARIDREYYELLQGQIEQRSREQAGYLQEKTMQSQILAQALETARMQLANQFKKTDATQQYLEQLFNSLTK
jgi:hypothetical protein